MTRYTLVPLTKAGGGTSIPVRAELFDGDIDAALDRANSFKRPGEVVLNTIPLNEP